MTDMDWNDLANQPLPSLGGGGNGHHQGQWTATTSATAPPFPTSPQQQHLLFHTMPPPAVNNNSSNNNSSSSSSSINRHLPSNSETLEDRITREEGEHMAMLRQRLETKVRQQVQQRLDAQLEEDWKKERERWITEVIHDRTLGGVADLLSLSPQGSSSSPHLLLKQQRSGRDSSAMNLMGTAGPSVNYPLRSPGTTNTTVNLEFVRAHGEIVESCKNNVHSLLERLANLAQLVGEENQTGGYVSAWSLVRSLLPLVEGRGRGRRPPEGPVPLALATMSFLCRQFYDTVVHRLRQAKLNGGNDVTLKTRRNYRNDMAIQCTAYIQLVLGEQEVEEKGGDAAATPSSFWPVVYACLRCGHAGAAAEVYEYHAGTNHQTDVARLLQSWSHAQGGGGSSNGGGGDAMTMWERGPPPQRSAADRLTVVNLLENAKKKKTRGEKASNLYQIAVYTLLAGSELLPTSENAPGISAIEDYLFGALHKAIVGPDNTADQLKKLGASMKEYGPNYFGSLESGGWAYTLPLLVTQEYGTALKHLSQAGGATGLVQAAHLALVLSLADIKVQDLSCHDETEIASALLVKYAHELVAMDPSNGVVAALAYLARLNDPVRRRNEAARLIAATGELDKLSGTLNEDGTRQQDAPLDKHFNAREIEGLLAEAAEVMSKNTRDRMQIGTALRCYMLAGRHTNVLALLNELLSPPDAIDDNRLYWVEQTESFYARYLGRRTHVLEAVEKEGRMDLTNTGKMLVEMNKFFQRLRENQYEDAWATVMQLKLLPISNADLAAKENQYRALDPMIKAAMPQVVVGAMEALHHQHRDLKFKGGTAPVLRERLRELKEQARLLVTFAGLAGMVSGQIEKLSRLEAQIV